MILYWFSQLTTKHVLRSDLCKGGKKKGDTHPVHTRISSPDEPILRWILTEMEDGNCFFTNQTNQN